ncbi:Ferric uptake regulator family protein [Pseudoxanthomonas sp. GM95]|uniref:Fur family transcriptional regulator n=1 Tax=Pseudoxanthomonas sp. GM95 TaxID=1881043 RepID=UPI0008CA3878|nr:transcriptional repressor [Pseudoxanthomonas sp. GM95]SEM11781.1 Ferric uptake regulator family protein [Pseudoxanthomonas sp. GM95]
MTEAALAHRMQAAGLRMTAPRRALLALLSQQPAACDAIELHRQLQATCPHASLGTVYRLLRELERRQLAVAIASPHGRTLWRLCTQAPPSPNDDVATSAWLRSLAAQLGYRLVRAS